MFTSSMHMVVQTLALFEDFIYVLYISRSRTDLRGIPRGSGQAPHLPIVGGSLLPDVVHNRSGQPGMMLFWCMCT